ncbi:MAG TPA: HNH endonuclease [Candidatus Barnesiella excrementigallinarum]|nr:HNH endonuclease [Candidatus Barnesiella excrementigallinarum]
MNICGQKFQVEDVFDSPITVPDCIVVPKNKLGTGNGEAKLYIASKDRMRSFYGGEGFRAKCFILKEDLISYMRIMKSEYFHPTQNYRGKDDFENLWRERMKKIEGLHDIIEFYIQDQTQIEGVRGYVNSTDQGYKLIRELSLPLVSYISVMQLIDSGKQPIYYWKLFADFDAISDKTNATVFRYGKKTVEEKDVVTKRDQKRIKEIQQARIGQGLYREKLLEECPFCPITMINDERLLIASHIKPWAIASDKERIDPKNGFMLSPLYDKLFDRGFITFSDDRRVRVSNWLSPQNQKRIGIKNNDFFQLLPIDEARKVYLEYHRDTVFKG